MRASAAIMLASGLGALACAPTILIRESLGLSDQPFHAVQFGLCVIALLSGRSFLKRSRVPGDSCAQGEDPRWLVGFARLTLLLAGTWLLLIFSLVVFWTAVGSFMVP